MIRVSEFHYRRALRCFRRGTVTKPPCTGGNTILLSVLIQFLSAILNLHIRTKSNCQLTWFLQFVSNLTRYPHQKLNQRKLAEKKTFLRAIEVVYIFMEANMN